MSESSNGASPCYGAGASAPLTVRGTTIYTVVRIPVPMWIPAYLPKGPQ